MTAEMDLGSTVTKNTEGAEEGEVAVVMKRGRITVKSFGVLNLSFVLLGPVAAETLALVALASLEFGFAVYLEVQTALVSHL